MHHRPAISSPRIAHVARAACQCEESVKVTNAAHHQPSGSGLCDLGGVVIELLKTASSHWLFDRRRTAPPPSARCLKSCDPVAPGLARNRWAAEPVPVIVTTGPRVLPMTVRPRWRAATQCAVDPPALSDEALTRELAEVRAFPPARRVFRPDPRAVPPPEALPAGVSKAGKHHDA